MECPQLLQMMNLVILVLIMKITTVLTAAEIIETLEMMGFEVETSHHEVAPANMKYHLNTLTRLNVQTILSLSNG